jgi:hypothetical protein
MTGMATLLLVIDLSVVLWLLIFLVILLFGVLIIVGALMLALKGRRFRNSVATTEGTVLKSTHSVREVGGRTLLSSLYSHTNYYATIKARYEPKPGEPLEVTDKIKIPLGSRDYFDGDKIIVYYDPSDPKSAKLAKPSMGPIVARLVVFGAIGVIVMLLSLAAFPWRLFDPYPPRGAFPDSIAGFTRTSGLTYDNYASYGDHSQFEARYEKSDKTIAYEVVEYSSAATAKDKVAHKYYLGGDDNILQNTEDRSVSAHVAAAGSKITGYQTVLALGPHLIEISGSTLDDVIAFENGLPYAAFGVSAPPAHSATEINGGVWPPLTTPASPSEGRPKQGEALYQSLLDRKKANAPQIYGAFKGGSLVLVIDQDEWQKLSKEQQVDLAYYVESLITSTRAKPEVFISVPASDFAYSSFVENGKTLCDDCWEVATGEPIKDGSISYDHTVVQGDKKWEKADPCCRGLKGSEFRGH